MSDSVLNKEFKSEDVNRIRNIVTKNFTQKTTVGSGYTKATVKRKEAEIWEEDGRTWTIKNGIKQNITKLDSARELAKIPLICPKCSKSMSHHLDKKMYKIHRFCFDCTASYASQLRKLGVYDQYEKSIMKKGVTAFAKDLEQMVTEFLEESTSEGNFVTESGDVEDWKFNKKDFKEANLKKLNEFLQHINSST
jgi:hypothetical protein